MIQFRSVFMKKQLIYEAICSVPLFKSLTNEQINSAILSSRITKLESGESLTSDQGICVILKGSVAAEKRSGDKKLLMRTFGAGSVSGVASLFSNGENDTLSTLTALSKTEMLIIDQQTVTSLIHVNGAFALDYIAFLTSRIRFLNSRIKAYTASGATSKLAMHFLLSDEHESGTVTLHVSLSRLADMLDMGRASLYRALDALSDSKIISKDAKTVTILDRNALRRVADGELKL